MGRKNILIVDDEKDVLSVLEKGLTSEGYSVITASSGNDAIGLAKSRHPDLIILDVLMPGMDGGEVARKLKEVPETKDIPVMFLTGMFPKKEERKNGRVAAGHVLFEKPYDILELVAAIEELLGEKVLSR